MTGAALLRRRPLCPGRQRALTPVVERDELSQATANSAAVTTRDAQDNPEQPRLNRTNGRDRNCPNADER